MGKFFTTARATAQHSAATRRPRALPSGWLCGSTAMDAVGTHPLLHHSDIHRWGRYAAAGTPRLV
jgi:hypothetical protein